MIGVKREGQMNIYYSCFPIERKIKHMRNEQYNLKKYIVSKTYPRAIVIQTFS